MKLKYTEMFFSLQGEGRFVGVPSVFLRTYSCNFRCMNFGLPRGEPSRAKKAANGIKHNSEVQALLDSGILASATKLSDLPIIHTGCDTYASIYPEFKKMTNSDSVDEVVEKLLALTPAGKWTMDNGQDIHLILTGGEPLLGWQRLYIELFEHPKMADLKNVTFETNTSQFLQADFKNYLNTQTRFNLTWSCSPKLSISGESWEDAICPRVAAEYASVNDSHLYFKFVVADRVDIEEANKAVQEYRAAGIEAPVYLMPLGGHSDEYNLNEKQVSDLCLEKGWRFSPRLHLQLYGNAWGT